MEIKTLKSQTMPQKVEVARLKNLLFHPDFQRQRIDVEKAIITTAEEQLRSIALVTKKPAAI